MRDIYFRGICKDSKRWVYGYYVHFEDFSQGINNHSICSGYYNTHFEVIPETVGQYTGLSDKNGRDIFEGDVVKDITPLYKGFTPHGREKMLKERAKKRGIAVVKFGYHDVKADDPFCVGRAYGVYFEGDMEFTTPAQYYGYGDWQESEDYQFEVIGNIWDNPELLEGET